MPRQTRPWSTAFTSNVALGLVLLVPASSWAQTPAERAAQRQQAERRIVRLEKKLAAVTPRDVRDQAHAEVARRFLDLAREALDQNNEQAARVWTEQATRTLSPARSGGEP